MPTYTEPAQVVRLIIADVQTGDDQLLADDMVEGFLALENQNVKLAAASALDTIASSEVLVSKAIRTQDLTTDGAKVSDALRKHAASLREQVAAATVVASTEVESEFTAVYPDGQGVELTERW